MKSVFLCIFLALAKYGFAANVCNQDVPNDAALVVSCVGDKMLKYPIYDDLTAYYTCSGSGQLLFQRCPANQYFCYYRQNCGDCSNFIAPPNCEFFAKRTNSKCSSKAITTAPTKAPTPTRAAPVTKPPVTTVPTPASPTTPKVAPTLRPPKTTDSPIPTPPSQSTPSSGIPMPPMVVTPVPGIPTPPNENVTPPSIPGTPPMLTTVQSI